MKRALFSLFASLLFCFSGAKMLPDSVEYFVKEGANYPSIPYNTSLYTYDPEGRVITETTRSKGQLSQRFEYTYVNGDLSEEINYFYNSSTSAWVPRFRAIAFYNYAGRDSAYTRYSYNKVKNEWEISMSYLYGWDHQDRIVSAMLLYKNEFLPKMDTASVVEFMYLDADTLPDSMTVTDWMFGVKMNGTRITRLEWENGFSHDQCEMNPSHAEYYTFQDGVWKLTSYRTSVFKNGKIIDRYFYIRNDNDSLALYANYHFDYDAEGNRIVDEEYYYTYDLDPKGVKNLRQSYKTLFTYSNNGTILQEDRTYILDNGAESQEKLIYHYPPGMMGVRQQQLANLIYPNPVSSSHYLSVENADEVSALLLYAADGKLIRSWITVDQQGVQLENIAAGVYFIWIADKAGNSTTQRLIIK